MSKQWYRVGEVAERVGLSVRALHHYDAIGLLSPSTHSASGHRLYGARELERLELILLYRQMGFALEDIRVALDAREQNLADVLREQVERLQARLLKQQRQLRKLAAIGARLDAGDILTAGDLLETLEITGMFDQYFDDNQREQLERRRTELSTESLEQVQRDWRALFEDLEVARCEGLAPSDESLRIHFERARELIAAFTGGDAGIADSLARMANENNAEMFRMWGISEDLGKYYLAAMEAHAPRA